MKQKIHVLFVIFSHFFVQSNTKNIGGKFRLCLQSLSEMSSDVLLTWFLKKAADAVETVNIIPKY